MEKKYLEKYLSDSKKELEQAYRGKELAGIGLLTSISEAVLSLQKAIELKDFPQFESIIHQIIDEIETVNAIDDTISRAQSSVDYYKDKLLKATADDITERDIDGAKDDVEE